VIELTVNLQTGQMSVRSSFLDTPTEPFRTQLRTISAVGRRVLSGRIGGATWISSWRWALTWRISSWWRICTSGWRILSSGRTLRWISTSRSYWIGGSISRAMFVMVVAPDTMTVSSSLTVFLESFVDLFLLTSWTVTAPRGGRG